MGSYNYLGFAAADEYCTPRVIDSLKKFSPSTCSVRVDAGMTISLVFSNGKEKLNLVWNNMIMFCTGTTNLHTELEDLVARFVGKPAAILFGMGYVTNSAIIPALIGKVCLMLFLIILLMADN